MVADSERRNLLSARIEARRSLPLSEVADRRLRREADPAAFEMRVEAVFRATAASGFRSKDIRGVRLVSGCAHRAKVRYKVRRPVILDIDPDGRFPDWQVEAYGYVLAGFIQDLLFTKAIPDEELELDPGQIIARDLLSQVRWTDGQPILGSFRLLDALGKTKAERIRNAVVAIGGVYGSVAAYPQFKQSVGEIYQDIAGGALLISNAYAEVVSKISPSLTGIMSQVSVSIRDVGDRQLPVDEVPKGLGLPATTKRLEDEVEAVDEPTQPKRRAGKSRKASRQRL